MRVLLVLTIYISSFGCSQGFGPGYSFEIFKDTPNWELAKAVEKEDEKEIKELLNDTNLNINFQETKFGNTLLHLAVGNDKLTSTRLLLQAGAKLNIKDSANNSAIHEASKFINSKKNSLQILGLLINSGADVNEAQIKIKDDDTAYFYVPLMGASQNLNCAKLLLDHGANPYIKDRYAYIIWTFMTTDVADENIYFAKYLIVEKRMPVPNPVSYSVPDSNPLDIFHFLNKQNFGGDKDKEKVRVEILEYLHKNNFPQNGVYSQ